MKQIERMTPQYQTLPGMLDPIAIREFRGLNTYDPFSVPDNYFTHVTNLEFSDYPKPTVRPGYSQLGAANGTKVLGLAVWKGTELHAVFNDGSWRKWTGSEWTTLKTGLNTTADWSFTNYQGAWDEVNLVGCNGVNGLHRYNGSTVMTFGNAPVNINFITTYQNRLWGASGKELHSCALDRPTDWQDFGGTESDSYVKDMESSTGDPINMLSGGLSKLTIGMAASLHELYGGMPSDFRTRLVTEDTGTSNHKSAFIQDALIRFVNKHGIYEYQSGGVAPDRDYSDVVRGLYAEGIAAVSDGSRFYFMLKSGDLLVFEEATQSWSRWKGINANCFTMFKGELYVGDSQGRVLRLGGQSDAGVDIEWEAITKPFTNSTTGQKSRWLKLGLVIEVAAGTEVKLSLSESLDGDDFEEVATLTGTGLKIEKILIPVRKFTLSHMLRIKIAGKGWAKLHEITRQGRILQP